MANGFLAIDHSPSRLAAGVLKVGDAIGGGLTAFTTGRLSGLQRWTRRYWGHEGAFARSWAIGTTALWIAVLLSVYVLAYYV